MWLSQCACRYGWLFKCVHDGLCVGVLVRVSRSILWFLTLDVTPAQLAQCGSKRFYNAVLHGCVFTSECLVKVGVILAEVGIKVKVFGWGLNYINLKKEKEKQAEWELIREMSTVFFNILKQDAGIYFLFRIWDLKISEAQFAYVSVLSGRTGGRFDKRKTMHIGGDQGYRSPPLVTPTNLGPGTVTWVICGFSNTERH